MSLTPCKECGQEISRVAVSCPRCGAHYTAAHVTYHRGLTYSGGILLFFWLVTLAARRELSDAFTDYPVTAVRDLRVVLFLLGLILIAWGVFFGQLRNNLYKGLPPD